MDYRTNYARGWRFVCHKLMIFDKSIAGVDFGAKMAGTTAVTLLDGDQLVFMQSAKGKDADQWLVNIVTQYNISKVYIDAPLSLPGAYFGIGNDYNFRQSDIELNAMSPMFLGGLTARAIKLNATLSKLQVQCTEVYPGGFIRQNHDLKMLYDKKKLTTILPLLDQLNGFLPHQLLEYPQNYHQLDSLICWFIGYKHITGSALSVGNPSEGLIWI